MKQYILLLSLLSVLISCKQVTPVTNAEKTEEISPMSSNESPVESTAESSMEAAKIDESSPESIVSKAADLVTSAEQSNLTATIEKSDIAVPAAVSKIENVITKAETHVTEVVKTSVSNSVSEPISAPSTSMSTQVKEKAKEEIVYYEKEPRIAEKVEQVKIGKTKKETKTSTSTPPPPPVAISHTKFEALLSKYVSAAGKVNYKGIKSEATKLDEYLTQLENTDVPSLSKKEKLAFWINAYNAFTVKKIVDNLPVASITDLDGGKPWDVKWIKLNNKTLSLNNIENDIIRPTFKEPRIHFAVNCAAKSCPPLLAQAWTASNLESNFEKQTLAFINNGSYNQINADNPKVSKIFEWYAVDFGDLISFINKYSTVKINKSATVGYSDYDWALNN